MIECVHAYWLLLWLIGLFSRYSHRNCIINYPRRCHGGTMESPDEYLGRLNFPGARGVKGHRGALLLWRDGRSVVCVLVCVYVCVCERMRIVYVCAVHPVDQHSSFLSWSTHPRGRPPPPSPLILFQYLFIVTLSVWCRQMGDQERRVCLCTSCSKWWTFLSGMPLLVMLAA